MSQDIQAKLTAAGWIYQPDDGFIGHVGGFWLHEGDVEKEDPARGNGLRRFGFIASKEHVNRNGTVHGGMLMTFLDRAFGMSARLVSGAEKGATISLNTQFMAPMQIGEFAEITPRVVSFTNRLAFLEGGLMREKTPLVAAQGVWRLSAQKR